MNTSKINTLRDFTSSEKYANIQNINKHLLIKLKNEYGGSYYEVYNQDDNIYIICYCISLCNYMVNCCVKVGI